MKKNQPFPYRTMSAMDGGVARSIARISCIRCDAHEDWTINGPHNPEKTCKAFRAAGWECDWSHPNRTICPACIARKRSGGKEHQQVAVAPTPPPNEDVKKETDTTMADPMTTLKPEHRLQIRALLDKHFDDAKGYYLDGYSDQKIGADINVPWAAVAKIREAAYGPIKSDPEVESLRVAVAELEKQLAAVKARLSAMERRHSTAAA